MSDDGALAIVIIAMQGNPFSPVYARARQRGGASALRFCSMNVAVYGRPRLGGRGSAWAFDERPVSPRDRRVDGVAIGQSAIQWVHDRLVIDIDERTTTLGHPFHRPLRGRVTLTPETQPARELTIDAEGLHRWWPIAPLARIEVALRQPALCFRGHGYHDANAGAVPLEDTFTSWSWSRARRRDGAFVAYDARPRTGTGRSHAFRVGPDGRMASVEGTGLTSLGRSAWGIERDARVARGEPARVLRSLEDGPFYTRELVETRMDGERIVAMHETLAAHRLRRRWVRFCTGYRLRTFR
ncbi:MAG: carotenoid 1,2-hydratase [Sandaracinaceae bacterium]